MLMKGVSGVIPPYPIVDRVCTLNQTRFREVVSAFDTIRVQREQSRKAKAG